MNSEPLPDIWEADWEFTRLAQYLGLANHDMSGYFFRLRLLDLCHD